MKMTSTKAAAAAACWLVAISSFAQKGQDGGPHIDWRLRPAPTVAPAGPPNGPRATILYHAEWNTTGTKGQKGTNVSYCVSPFIRITSRPDARAGSGVKQQASWTVPFDLSLVDASGRPANARFRPVTVPTPIPADTTRELLPSPPWCAEMAGATVPPEIYLQVDRRRDRVIFDPAPPVPPPKASPR